MTHEVEVSVILCTYNPDYGLLKQTMDSLANQSVDSAEFEIIVVDNNSAPPLDQRFFDQWQQPVRLVREERQGLIHARVRGILEALGKLLVFVDDDNELSSDYLECAQQIIVDNPEIGAFGGVVESARPLDGIPRWKKVHLSSLAIRDRGPDPITSFEMRHGPWDPVGAGMAVRRPVADRFVSLVGEVGAAAGLGRSGSSLSSQEDTLIARCANLEGYACSYQPSLRLKHDVGEERLEWSYLRRLMEGMGGSYVTLHRVLDLPLKQIPTGVLGRVRLMAIFIFLAFTRGRSGLLKAYWHKGYLAQYSNSPD